ISKDVADLFKERTDQARNLQINLQKGSDAINLWLDEAFEEGLEQTAEALEEWYKVKELFGKNKEPKVKEGKQPKTKQQEQPEPDLHPHAVPMPPMPEDDKKRKKRYPIFWATQLLLPRSLQTTFERTKGERDEDERKQARMQLEWRRFRDPD